MVFCTCFDKGYLDKGLVLCRSLAENCPDFRLYIACFDSKTQEVLTELCLPGVILIPWERYETEAFLEKKNERTRAEYYWTCTTHIIEVVLDEYKEEHCIYIDADMAFFSDPTVLLDEIRRNDAHIGIIEHRFNHNFSGKRYLRRSGKFCVEFNYFDQTPESRRALRWWRDQCWEWCYQIYEKDRMGDQKYLEQFPALFQQVHVFENPGAGVAPWNLAQYKVAGQGKKENREKEGEVLLEYQGQTIPLIFYHFQNICYLNDNMVNVGTGVHDRKVKEAVYFPYLREIGKAREELRNYGVSFTTAKVASSNLWMKIWEKHFIRFKCKSLSDFIRLDQLES